MHWSGSQINHVLYIPSTSKKTTRNNFSDQNQGMKYSYCRSRHKAPRPTAALRRSPPTSTLSPSSSSPQAIPLPQRRLEEGPYLAPIQTMRMDGSPLTFPLRTWERIPLVPLLCGSTEGATSTVSRRVPKKWGKVWILHMLTVKLSILLQLLEKILILALAYS